MKKEKRSKAKGRSRKAEEKKAEHRAEEILRASKGRGHDLEIKHL